jgi:hypothetical protein
VEVQIHSLPLRVIEPNDAIRHGRARLVRYSEAGDPGPELATLTWLQVEYGYALDHGVDGFEIADAESQDLHDLHCAVFRDGCLREPFEQMAGVGHDLLVIERVEVASREHFKAYASELTEHVLRRWSQGCLAAVYMEDHPMDPQLIEVLLGRGFRWHKLADLGLYVAGERARGC